MARRRGFIKSKIPIAGHTQANLLVTTADYHLSALWLVLIDAYTKEPAAIQLYAHLRAFFWELYSFGELVLRQAETVPAIGSVVTSPEWANWWHDIGEYRNFSHQAFFQVNVLLQGTTPVDFHLPAARRSPVQELFRSVPDEQCWSPPARHYLPGLVDFARNEVLPKLDPK